jgi:hypothetical protein
MTQFDDIVVTPVYGPLSTNNYPCAMPAHISGTLPGVHPNPPLFYPSQEPVYSDQFVNARHYYFRTAQSAKALAIQRQRAILSATSHYTSYSTQKQYPVTTHMNYIAPKDSSQYIAKRKAMAVGKSSYKVGLPADALYTTKNYYPSGVRTSLRRARSGGCTAPPKKSSIYNYSLRNGAVCGWGSIVRQNY